MKKDTTPGRDTGQLVAFLAVVVSALMVALAVIWGALGNLPFYSGNTSVALGCGSHRAVQSRRY